MAVYKSEEITKDGRQWFFRLRYKDIFGMVKDYHSIKYLTKKEALEEEAKFRIKVGEEKLSSATVTFEQAYYGYMNIKKEGVKIQTIEKTKNLYNHLSPIYNKKINSINVNTYQSLRDYIASLNFSVDHSNKIQNLFKQVILYSKKYNGTSDTILNYIVPFKEVNKFKKEMDFFTYEEYQKFDKVIDSFEYHTFFEILYFVGLRCGELMGLTYKDIDFNKGTISINKTCTTKISGQDWTISTPKTKNSIRVLPIKKSVLEDLKIMQIKAMQYKDYSNDWFVFGNVRPYAESSIAKAKNKYCKLADLKQIRVHDFRHSFASLMINQGASITLISKYLGHSSVSITLDIYSHFYKSELDNLLDKINKL